MEIIIGAQNYRVYVWHDDGTLLDGDGDGVADWPQLTQEPLVNSSPALADLDGDGMLEIVAATYGDGGGILFRCR